MSKLTGYLLPANGEGRVIEVENELHALQKIVGGNIEVVRLATDLIILANEEGLIFGLPRNRHIPQLVGDLLALSTEGEEFASLNQTQLEACKNIFGERT